MNYEIQLQEYPLQTEFAIFVNVRIEENTNWVAERYCRQ